MSSNGYLLTKYIEGKTPREIFEPGGFFNVDVLGMKRVSKVQKEPRVLCCSLTSLTFRTTLGDGIFINHSFWMLPQGNSSLLIFLVASTVFGNRYK